MTKKYENKVKKSLQDTIDKWWMDNDWDLETNVCDETFRLMTESAFNILLAQKGLTDYCRENNNGEV